MKDTPRRPRQLGEGRDLLVEPGIDVAGARRGSGPEGGGAGEADHRRQLWVAGLDAGVHVAAVPRPEVEQFDDVADGGRVVIVEQFQVGGGDGWHGAMSSVRRKWFRRVRAARHACTRLRNAGRGVRDTATGEWPRACRARSALPARPAARNGWRADRRSIPVTPRE